MDGSVLSAPYDPSDSQRRPSPRGSSAPATEVMIAPTVAAAEKPYLQSTIRAPAPQAPPRYSKESSSSAPAVEGMKVSSVLRWALVLRGSLAIALALLGLLLHSITVFEIVTFYAAYAFAGGGFAIVAGVMAQTRYQAGRLLLMEGILGVITGVVVLLATGFNLRLFILVLAWLTIGGVLQILAAIRLRKYLAGTWLMVFAGAISLVSGFGMYFGLGGYVTITGFPVFSGALLLAFGVSMRSLDRRFTR
jgi:uncharacterized membrane protein HdeD (DUF308 family)